MPAARLLRGTTLAPPLKMRDGINQTNPILIYRFTFFAFCFFACGLLTAQGVNLVPNGSFEDRDLCIYNNSYVEDAYPWYNPCNYEFLQATPDLFHVCAIYNEDPCPYPVQVFLDPWLYGIPTNSLGCEETYDGNGYAGLFVFGPNNEDEVGYREYLAVGLEEPMQEGLEYVVSFQVSLAERMGYSIWNLQVLFSEDSIIQPFISFIEENPQLSGSPQNYLSNYDGWQELSWNYTAAGGEEFMAIGNFQANDETDTLYVLEQDPEDHYVGYSYYYIDDVRVTETPLSLNSLSTEPGIQIYPNPNIGEVSVVAEDIMSSNAIFDLNGKRIFHKTIFSKTSNIEMHGFSDGFYMLEIEFIDGTKVRKKISKAGN